MYQILRSLDATYVDLTDIGVMWDLFISCEVGEIFLGSKDVPNLSGIIYLCLVHSSVKVVGHVEFSGKRATKVIKIPNTSSCPAAVK